MRENLESSKKEVTCYMQIVLNNINSKFLFRKHGEIARGSGMIYLMC